MINYHILPDSIVLNFEGKTIPIAKGDGRYNSVIDAIKADKLESIPDIIDNEKYFNSIDDKLELRNNTLYLDGIAMPESLADRVIQFRDEQLPYGYLLKFARKLRLNPSFNSKQMLFKFLEHNGHPITPNGNFIAYRGVSSNYTDLHTGKFDNSIGAVCEISRDQVDDNPNNTCSNGLHVACYEYAKGFGPVMIEVEVDPRDVVCVPTDYNGTKMRVCKFKVVNNCKNIRNEALYTESEHLEYCEDDELEGFDDEIEEDSYNLERVRLAQSDLIAYADYNPKDGDLIVTLHSGARYCYHNVPESIVNDWEMANSAGSYFNKFISRKYLWSETF